MSYDPRLPIPNSGITDPADKLYFLDSHFQRTWLRQTELFTDSHNRLTRVEARRNYSVNTSVAATGANTTATVLQTYTMPANAARVGNRIRIKAFGATGGNGNTKTITLKFGSTSLVTLSGAYNNLGWLLDAEVAIQSTTAQIGMGTGMVNATAPTVSITAPAADLSTPVTITINGQNGTATAADIVCYSFAVSID